MLANLYVNADAMHQLVSYQPPYRQSIRSHLPHEIQSRVRDECGDIFVPTDDNLLILAIPETCELSFSDALLEQANMAINSYDRFELELTQRLADLDVKSRAIEAHISVLDSIIVELCNYDLGPSDC